MGESDVPHGFFVSASKGPWKADSMAFLISGKAMMSKNK
jgi:hypothetical protein